MRSEEEKLFRLFRLREDAGSLLIWRTDLNCSSLLLDTRFAEKRGTAS